MIPNSKMITFLEKIRNENPQLDNAKLLAVAIKEYVKGKFYTSHEISQLKAEMDNRISNY